MTKEFVENKIPIHLDLSPTRDEFYSGVCLKFNDEILILVNYDVDQHQYDGFTILRSFEVEKYRAWDQEELKDIQGDNLDVFIDKINLSQFGTFKSSLNTLKTLNQLVAVFTEEDEEDYYLGLVVDIDDDQVQMKLVDEKGNWIGVENVLLEDITYIGFDTEYERELMVSALN